jgi:hypothetical protein
LESTEAVSVIGYDPTFVIAAPATWISPEALSKFKRVTNVGVVSVMANVKA